VVVVFDVGTFDEKVFIAMEFVDGNTVTYWLEQQTRTWQEILRIFIAAGRGLIAAHEKGLVHRDFKPDNVMVGKDGQVRVMDFGLARQMPERSVREHRLRPITPNRGSLKVSGETLPVDQGTLVLNEELNGSGASGHSSVSGLFDARLTRTGAMMGTPAYMAPEQFFGAPTDARTDQFSFCVSLYEALYGERPFEGKRLTELTANVVQGTVREAPAATKVPFWVRRILLRGLRSAAGERYQSMAELLEDLGRDPRAKRRKWAVGAAVAMLPLAVGLGVRQSVVSQRVVCGGGNDKFAGIWELHRPDQPEGPHQSQIHAAFMRTGKPYAADVYETVTRALTRYAQGWSNMYQEACEATHARHEQSEEVLDLRMSCLQERLNGFHALTDVFADASGEVVENAVSATNALSTLDRCADVPTLRAVVKPPDDPATLGKVTSLRKRMADLKARFDAGRWKETLKEAPDLVAGARATNYQPLIAEALALVGTMHSSVNDPQPAEKELAEAYRLSDASRHDAIRAEVATELVFVVGDQEARFEDASRWSDSAAAVLQRLGGNDLLHAWLLNNLGCTYGVHHEVDTAVRILSEGLAVKKKLLGADDPDVAGSEGNLGYVLKGAERYTDALPHIDAAIGILENKLGPAHPRLAVQIYLRGQILNALDRPRDARRSFERAIAIWERELGSAAPILAYPLTGIGISYLSEGSHDNAVPPLEQAIRIGAHGEIDPVWRAETDFTLARALWATGRQSTRSRQLAEGARSAYEKGSMSKELAAVDAWLRSHSGPPG
jgi:tetratricopeptide (TPR) repeat protein